MQETFYTPDCECLWAFLQEPKVDTEGDYPDAYQISIILDYKEQADLLKQISELHKTAGGKAKVGEKGHPIKLHGVKNEDGDIELVKNKYTIRFKTNAEYAELGITTLDSQKKQIFRKKNFVANGSVVRVAWRFKNYDHKGNKGVSLFLDCVQIINLIEWSGGFDVDNSSFEKVEGYESGDTVDVAFPVDDVPGDDIGEQDGVPVEPDQDGSPMKEEQDDLPFRRV